MNTVYMNTVVEHSAPKFDTISAMIADWLLAQFSLHAPGFWFLLSLVMSVLFAVLPHYGARGPWLRQSQIALTFLIPYLGLIFGGLSPRLMGISGVDWQATLGLGLGLCFVLLSLLILVRATLALAAPVLPHPQPVEPVPPVVTAAWHLPALTGMQSGLVEFHWAFLRGAFWEMFLTLPNAPDLPAYWAVWTAAALAAVEIFLRQKDSLQVLTEVAILSMTSILFFYTRNFWLCWLLHSAARLLLVPAKESPGRNRDVLDSVPGRELVRPTHRER